MRSAPALLLSLASACASPAESARSTIAIEAIARADLPLQVKHAESSIRTVDADGRRAVLLRQARYQRQAHLAHYVECRIICGAEDLGFEELAPAAAELVDQRRANRLRVGRREVLRTSQVVALVVSPERDAGFIGVVEHVSSRQLIIRRELVVDASRVIILLGHSAEGRAQVVERAVRRVRTRYVFEERQ